MVKVCLINLRQPFGPVTNPRYMRAKDVLPPLDVQNRYVVTSSGEIWELSPTEKDARGRPARFRLRPSLSGSGSRNYLRVTLRGVNAHTGDPLAAQYMVSHLVYAHFVPGSPPPRRMEIGYRDGDPLNCAVDNLYLSHERELLMLDAPDAVRAGAPEAPGETFRVLRIDGVEWPRRPEPGDPDRDYPYEVSNFGRVRQTRKVRDERARTGWRVDIGAEVKAFWNGNNRVVDLLRRDGRIFRAPLAKLVWHAFNPEYPCFRSDGRRPMPVFRDHDRSNVRLDNLIRPRLYDLEEDYARVRAAQEAQARIRAAFPPPVATPTLAPTLAPTMPGWMLEGDEYPA